MSLLTKRLRAFVGAFLILSSLNVQAAGIPVIDAANLAQAIQQVASWARQYQQMYQQITELQQSYQNLHGARGMGSLVNNPASRQYLPAEYQTILSQGVGQWQAIYEASKKFDIHTTTLTPQSDAVQIYEAVAKQAAINRAVAEEGYKTASQRFGDLQVLLEKVNNAPDAKDIADLQARIQIEQAMLQNEANKLQTLAMLASAQRELAAQQSIEIAMKSWKGGLPSGW